MLFGDTSEFAIECEVTDQVDSFTYCHFRFWLAGQSVGDYEHESVLGTIASCAQGFLRYRGQRRLPLNVTGETEFEKLTELTQSDDAETMQTALEIGARHRFALHEVADDAVGAIADLYVLDGQDVQRMIAKSPRASGAVLVRNVSAGRVDAILDDFMQWAERCSSR